MPKIKLPVTRYYGSKRKLINKIWTKLEELELNFDSVLDVFGGTGTFSYYAKKKGKEVIYNDIFKFNSFIGKKLIEQSSNELTIKEAKLLLKPKKGVIYNGIITENFGEIYFTDEENNQIDTFIQNINFLRSENKKLSAYYLIFQACLIKRPYNLFHRKNLNMRVNYKGGNFGNKKTWERPFEELFERFIKELNEFTFDNGRENKSTNKSALDCNETADLVYIDPPYFNNKGHHTTYHSKYHFLEGLANYNDIISNIDHSKKNKEIKINKSDEFERKETFLRDLKLLIDKHPNSNIVISYRNNGVPSINELEELIQETRENYINHTIDLGTYGYALNKSNNINNEFLIVSQV
ncbi:DNA adenine methylase [Tenacibaculum mesophilum]|uniref:DNA adenine methylase n=1 Tax=Tenacibaculum mesophilum TaxID=104268 RepID=UPI0014308A22|nr:DNA adenine methylase [Tenacibaculum mesophilum]KAF9659991.1 DNA adenine methylase [Tenacibaculum mesophilum]